MKKFDVFVIGTGVAGTIIANKSAENGLKTGIVDNREYGGTCVLHGCIPKKILVGVTEAVASSKNLEGKGVLHTSSINWRKLMAFKNTFTASVPNDKETDFKEKGISTYHGNPKFLTENRLIIGDDIIESDKIVIATGATARELVIPGSEYALSSDYFLEMKELPDSMFFIGGGYIAFEFAHIAARSGSKVTILDMESSVLPHFDKDIVPHLVDATKELGIELVMNTKVSQIKKNENGYTVIGNNNGKLEEITADVVFNTSGRVPAIQHLDLDKGNVRYSDKGIEVSYYMQSTTNPSVYAAGDNTATFGLPLTPFATMEGHIVSANIRNGNTLKPDYNVRPTAVYTLPTLAMVGMTEEQARNHNPDIKVKYASVPNWYTAKHLGENIYAYKVIIDNKTDLILGAHIIGPNAEETINVFAVAMQANMKAHDLMTIPFAFPSASSDIAKMI